MRFLIILSTSLLLSGVLAVPKGFLSPWKEIDSLREKTMAEDIDLDNIMRTSGLDRLSDKCDIEPSNRCPNSIKNFDAEKDVQYILFNKNHPDGVDITLNGTAGLIPENHFIKVLIHGFLNFPNFMVFENIKAGYRMREVEDYTIITVDWTRGSGSWITDYFPCVMKSKIIPKVGEAVSKLVLDMVEQQEINILYINLIGHSLGAHIAGIAGKRVVEAGHHIPIIVGLDPALPGYKDVPQEERLAPTDAIYTEAIHTSPGELGFNARLASADFYVNYEPKILEYCSGVESCKHSLGYSFFTQTVIKSQRFKAVQCETIEEAKAGQCESQITALMGGLDMRYGKQEGIFTLNIKESDLEKIEL